jgi:GxxExxY protein
MKAASINDLSHDLIGAAIEVHRELGPGLLESAYETALAHELTRRQIPQVRQKQMPNFYKGVVIETGYRIDIVADERIIIELKSVEKLIPLHAAQLLTCLRLARLPLGLLVNFNVGKLVGGIERVANRAPAPSAFRS